VRFLEFFAANIRNPHTRRAYARAVVEFLAWCEGREIRKSGKQRKFGERKSLITAPSVLEIAVKDRP
jgi:hypothetical protein